MGETPWRTMGSYKPLVLIFAFTFNIILAEFLTEDGNLQLHSFNNEDKIILKLLGHIIKSKQASEEPPLFPLADERLKRFTRYGRDGSSRNKMQRVMFHQCYSNPVSCFK